jgi:tripartite-type tricarboxylate transporter receptor subunit TctC
VGPARKVTFRPLSIVKYIDKTTPVLFQCCCSGKPFKDVILTLTEPLGKDAQTTTSFTLNMKLVAVKSITYGDAVNPTETIEFELGGAIVTVVPHWSDGRVMPPLSMGGTVVKNIMDERPEGVDRLNRFVGARRVLASRSSAWAGGVARCPGSGASLRGAGTGRERRRLNPPARRDTMKNACCAGRRAALVVSILAVAAGLAPRLAVAQAWPDKPIRIVVGFPPGGAADQIARLVGQPLQDALGQPVVIENRTGAGGNVAGDAVAKSAPDGYTLLMSSGGMVSVNPHIYPKMTFDPAKDLTPVAAAARVSVYLVVRPEFPAKNIQEFLAYAKANPGKLSYGSPGNGSSPHLASEMINSQAGTSTRHIPYRGASAGAPGPARRPDRFPHGPGHRPASGAGRQAEAARVGGLQRTPLYPDVPTLDEAGLKGFDADTLFGFYAPAATPKPVIDRLNTEVNQILATKPVVERIGALGGATTPMTPNQFDAKARDDFQRFGAIIRERKIVGD